MCRIGFLAFESDVTQEARKKALATLLENSWNLGNKDGIGFVSFTPNEAEAYRALALKDLPFPETIGPFVLVHARYATTPKIIENVHPIYKDEAFLVHNGVVNSQAKYKEKVEDSCTTSCDSEFILNGYLAANRDLLAGLKKIVGSANVMLWDGKKQVLSLFPDNGEFTIWRQDGILSIVQEVDQTKGLILAGLGKPYETAKLEKGFVYDIPLTVEQPDWANVVLDAVEKAREFDLPSFSKTSYVNWGGMKAESFYGYGGYGAYGKIESYVPKGSTKDTSSYSQYFDERGLWHIIDEAGKHVMSECDHDAHPRHHKSYSFDERGETKDK